MQDILLDQIRYEWEIESENMIRMWNVRNCRLKWYIVCVNLFHLRLCSFACFICSLFSIHTEIRCVWFLFFISLCVTTRCYCALLSIPHIPISLCKWNVRQFDTCVVILPFLFPFDYIYLFWVCIAFIRAVSLLIFWLLFPISYLFNRKCTLQKE